MLRHPEQRDDEVFLANYERNIDDIGWESKRQGRVAFDIYGNNMSGFASLFPVFIKRAEIIERGKYSMLHPLDINSMYKGTHSIYCKCNDDGDQFGEGRSGGWNLGAGEISFCFECDSGTWIYV